MSTAIERLRANANATMKQTAENTFSAPDEETAKRQANALSQALIAAQKAAFLQSQRIRAAENTQRASSPSAVKASGGGTQAAHKTNRTFWYTDQNTPNFDPTIGPKPGRMADVLSGAGKAYAGSFANAAGTALEGLGRLNTAAANANNAGAVRAARENIARYKGQLAGAADTAERSRLETLIQRNQRNLALLGETTAFRESVSRNAAQPVYHAADALSASGAADIEAAKAGLGKAGQLAVDVGVAGTQMLADAGLGALTGGSALIPMAVRSFGGGTQEARQSGADFGTQLAYGAGSAAIQVGTEKLFNLAAPFKAMFGAGVLDNAIEKAVGQLTQSAAGRAALSALGEGAEEVIGSALDPILRRATFDKTARFDPEQALADGLVGGILGLIGGGVEAVGLQGGKAVPQAPYAAASEAAGTSPARRDKPTDAVTERIIQDLAGTEQAKPGQEQKTASGREAVKAGRVTAIQHRYQGVTPVQALKPDTSVTVGSGSVQTAQNAIADARGLEGSVLGMGFKAALKNAYKSMFKATKGVPVEGVTFEGKPYTVDINSNVAGKVISDPNLTAEKLALLESLPEVVRGGTYVGSGEYAPHRSKEKLTVRFDYFETPIEINGKQYIAAFDVEVFPNTNNYRTHKLHEIELSPITNADIGPAPTASVTETAPVEGTRTLNYDSTIAQGMENVNSRDVLTEALTGITGQARAAAGAESASSGSMDVNSSLGGARSGFDPYSHLQNQTDKFHDDGANAARLVDVPMYNYDGSHIPESAKTVMGAQAIDGGDVRFIERQIADGKLKFDTITDKDSVSKALGTVAEKGFDGALEQYRAAVNSGVAGKDNTTLGQQLLLQAMRSGNVAHTAELLSLYTRNSTTAAQAMQAQSVFRKLSPEGQLLAVQKSVDSFNQAHDTDVDIPEEDIDAFLQARDDEERADARRRIYQHVAQQVPGTFRAKYDAIRYLAMLGNPRTHIRNIMGNTLFQVPVAVKNRIGSAAEMIAKIATGGKYERTKSTTGVSPASALAKECRADWANARDFLTQDGGKYREHGASQIERERKAFVDKGLGKAVNTLSEANSALLEAEDTFIKRFIYKESLAGYLQANGVRSLADADPDLLNRARNYAAQEALRGTFNDTNDVSAAVSKLNRLRSSTSKTARAAGYVVEGVLPFKKTPANILVRGVEYSPVGAMIGAVQTARAAKSGDYAAMTQGIDRIASGLTGSALLAAGILAGGAGYVTGGEDEDKRQREFDDLLGRQAYALELPNGASVTLDWLAPASIPFFMGVQLQRSMQEGGMGLEDIMTVAKSVSDPMLEMSMLQGLNDIIDNAAYAVNSGGHVAGSIITSALSSYVTQVFPTLFGQLERVTEPERMSTYVDKNSALPTDLQYLLGKVSQKTPVLDYNQIPYIDPWGRTEGSGDVLTRLLTNSFSPAYLSQVDADAVETELQRVADEVGSTAVFPDRADKSLSYRVGIGDTAKSVEVNLTAEQYTEYAKTLGSMRYHLLETAMQSDFYHRLSDTERADYVADVYSYARAMAKKELFPSASVDVWMQNAKTAQQDLGVSTAEFIALHQKYGAALSNESTYRKVKTAVKSGISVDDYMAFKSSVDLDGNGSVSQAEAQSVLDAGSFTLSEKDVLWRTLNSTWKKNPYAQ